ncbi:hypothetical protein OU426_08500 [Frigidibacter sp. RF13]|uniref:hypothetical protein n=1 Tax=Frigidibacter sp. RF13 TaxID=2997340 RepID=UPI00226EE633|nr:hypothetical protein [Frigidibacter sp. RF13]MCY1126891.1 hypothetical protein [Frigidibacter sp. RF13]
MIAILRLLLFAFIGLSVFYLLLGAYWRSLRREALEKQWDAAPPDGQGAAERNAFIAKGMEAYERGLKKKLLWLVYVIPMGLIVIIAYVQNYQ